MLNQAWALLAKTQISVTVKLSFPWGVGKGGEKDNCPWVAGKSGLKEAP